MMIEKTCPRCNVIFMAKVYGKRSRACCSPSCSAKEHNKRHGMCLTREYKCWELLRDRVSRSQPKRPMNPAPSLWRRIEVANEAAETSEPAVGEEDHGLSQAQHRSSASVFPATP